MRWILHYVLIAVLFPVGTAGAQDWSGIPVPAVAGPGKEWALIQTLSDSFHYRGKGRRFTKRWRDTYFNSWNGPGLTEWDAGHSDVADGHLIIRASRKEGTERVYCGVITSRAPVSYPIFIEASIKVSNQVLSSNLWLLSEDDRRELDILEIYGGDRPNQHYFATHASNNHHIFVRDADNHILENWNDQSHHALAGKVPYRKDFHRFGAYWIDPWKVDFYIDGQLVRRLRLTPQDDPEGVGLDRAMYLIIDTEDHAWRSDKGIVATDAELADDKNNVMLVDWIRAYRPRE
ncbi:family 16 glycosylhydrolase [Lewinella sp. JB7]|uniref:family 16 glycosylhydrolase n=1 Tax=Lewinella sp. JB7 TaxID=2962887 RepID=UPI0020C93AC8|nr:family 16 glycosylhydrolase [Lewinella sp. JB7]MCP9235833.1 family 16 glycosylhydrolase [Lewinella sp. JB7]